MRSPTATATWLWPKSIPGDQAGGGGEPDGGAAPAAAGLGLDEARGAQLAHDVGDRGRRQTGHPGQLGLRGRLVRQCGAQRRRAPGSGWPPAATTSIRAQLGVRDGVVMAHTVQPGGRIGQEMID